MDRRDFLKLAGMAGLGVAVGLPSSRRADAADPYTGPLFCFVNAGGGWDPTLLCDPKGAASDDDPDAINRTFLTSQIEQAGNISYAPIDGIREFFQTHYQDVLVVNGIDCQTNSHDTGTRNTWAGTLTDNRPAFAALFAAAVAPNAPMAFITNGGYDQTAGLIAATRTGNLDAIRRAAYPNMVNVNDPDNTPFYHSEETSARITAARNARNESLLARQRLPRIQNALSTLYAARTGSNELKKLTEILDGIEFEQANLRRQAQFIMAAYQAGICVAANLSIGGFDTHGNHDNSHIPQLQELMDGVGFLKDLAASQIAGNIVIVVGSDFGRTPMYNDGNGKDHWSISSMLFMGKGITGNRVIGATDEGQNALTVNEAGALDESGFRIHNGHIHKELRRLAGIEDNAVMAAAPISEEETLNLFV